MIKAIIFDMDGVLVDSKKAWFVVFNKTLEHFEHKTVGKREFEEKIWAKNFNETAKVYFSVNLAEIRDYYQTLFNTFKENLGTFQDTSKVLDKLKQAGFRLIVATNTHREHAIRVLREVGLFKYFELVIGGDDVPNGKPEPDIILEAFKRLHLNAENVLYVGDTIWDSVACKGADVRFVGFGIDGDFRIDTLSGLLAIIPKPGTPE